MLREYLPVLAVAFIAIGALAGCEKGPTDEDVRRMCAVDGGAQVFEVIRISPDKFLVQDLYAIPSKDKATDRDDFFFVRDVKIVREGKPEVIRSSHRIVRRSDGKTVGEYVRYIRRGGDAPGPWHESQFACPEIGAKPTLEELVFLRQE